MEAGSTQLVTPRATLETMCDGQRRGKGRAVHVENGFTFGRTCARRCEMPEEQAQAGARAHDGEMTFAVVELHAPARSHGRHHRSAQSVRHASKRFAVGRIMLTA